MRNIRPLIASRTSAKPGRASAVFGLIAAISVTATACGPHTNVRIGVKEDPVDILYGDKVKPPPQRPAGAEYESTTAPGFVAAPVILSGPSSTATPAPAIRPASPVTGQPLGPNVNTGSSCSSAPPGSAPHVPAPVDITHPPEPGIYRYRRTGYVKFATPPAAVKDAAHQLLSTEIV